MKPEYKMLLWEQWRQTRAYLILPLFVVLIHAGMAVLLRISQMHEPDAIFLTDMYVLGVLLVAGVVFCLHFDRRMTLRLGVPERTFRLPISSSVLILCQLGYRMAVVLLIFLASLILHRVANGPETLLQVPGTLAFLAGFYAIALAVTSLVQPYSFGAKAKFLTPFFLFALAVAFPAWSAAASAPPLFAVLTVGAGLSGAIWAHGKARHGGLEWRGPAWRLRQERRFQSVSEIPRFASPLDAQRWLEQRRFGWLLPATGLLVSLSVVIYVLFSGANRLYWVPWMSPLENPPMVLAVVVPAGVFGIFLAYFDYKAPETPLGRYIFTRPISAALMSSARWRMAARSVFITTVMAFGIFVSVWLLLADSVHTLHPYSEIRAPFASLVQYLLEWLIFASVAFGIVFLVSRSLVIAIVLSISLMSLNWLLDEWLLHVIRNVEMILIPEGTVLFTLAVATFFVMRRNVLHPKILYWVLGGVVFWVITILLQDLARQAQISSWYSDEGFRGLNPFPIVSGIWVLVALTSLPLAFHRRRSQSLWATPLHCDTATLGQQNRALSVSVLAVLLVAGMSYAYQWKLDTAGAEDLGQWRERAASVVAKEHGVTLPPQDDLWKLLIFDWEALSQGARRAYFDLRKLRESDWAEFGPAEFPAPGRSLSSVATKDLAYRLEALQKVQPSPEDESIFSAYDWEKLSRSEITIGSAATVQALGSYHKLLEVECLLIWQLADRGAATKAWERFEQMFLNSQRVFGQPRALDQESHTAGQSIIARVFMHLLKTSPGPDGLWARLLAAMPEDYDRKTAILPAVAVYIANTEHFERGEATWQLRNQEFKLAGGSSNARERWINYLLYHLSGVARVERFEYVRHYYADFLAPIENGEVPFIPTRRIRRGDSPVNQVLMQGAWNQYMGAANYQIRQQLYRCAAAVMAYRADYGELPQRLSQLVPGYLDSLPADPYARNDWEKSHAEVAYYREATHKQPPVWSFHYRLDASGAATVYSVGSNGRDNFSIRNDAQYWGDDITLELGPLPGTP